MERRVDDKECGTDGRERGRTTRNARADKASDEHIKLGGHLGDPTLFHSERSDRLP